MPLPSLLRRPRELLSKLIVRLHEERMKERKGGIVMGGVFVRNKEGTDTSTGW